jgi:hypothetical protein
VAAPVGQRPLDTADGLTLAAKLGLPEEAVPVLAAVPMRGGLPTAVPTDPTIYRLYEVLLQELRRHLADHAPPALARWSWLATPATADLVTPCSNGRSAPCAARVAAYR